MSVCTLVPLCPARCVPACTEAALIAPVQLLMGKVIDAVNGEADVETGYIYLFAIVLITALVRASLIYQLTE